MVAEFTLGMPTAKPFYTSVAILPLALALYLTRGSSITEREDVESN